MVRSDVICQLALSVVCMQHAYNVLYHSVVLFTISYLILNAYNEVTLWYIFKTKLKYLNSNPFPRNIWVFLYLRKHWRALGLSGNMVLIPPTVSCWLLSWYRLVCILCQRGLYLLYSLEANSTEIVTQNQICSAFCYAGYLCDMLRYTTQDWYPAVFVCLAQWLL